ncbi:amino acid adenylation domain-containing protein [Chitinophaga sp.]|uniref:amino acid adenylation domain-containing protein n=1 Tax=Chitinophaga sp. TaxID=1869181 RepID=UPI002F95A036
MLREYLSRSLPYYMIPAYLVQLPAIPLTPNKKVDRSQLPDPKAEKTSHVAPVSQEEKVLARIWANVLNMPQVGVTDNFFSLGGDSIKSIQISARARNEGYDLAIKDIFNHLTIRALAPKLKALVAMSDQQMIEGKAGLTPVQQWFFQSGIVNRHHFNQSVTIQFNERVDEGRMLAIFQRLLEHHDALRMIFKEEDGRMIMTNTAHNSTLSLVEYHTAQSSIDLANGPLVKLALTHEANTSSLLIVVHHLVIDGISWRILFEDFNTLFNNLQAELPLKTDAFLSWPDHLSDYMHDRHYLQARTFWAGQQQEVARIPRDYAGGSNKMKERIVAGFSLDKTATSQLLSAVHKPFNTQVNDTLLAALYLAIHRLYGIHQVSIDLEGHGREDLIPGVNIGRTIGWFSSIYPVRLDMQSPGLKEAIVQTKESLRKIPNKGFDYLLYRYFDENGITAGNSQLFFNYLGQFDADTNNGHYTIADDNTGQVVSPDETWNYDWDFLGKVVDGQLQFQVSYSGAQYREETMNRLMHTFRDCLLECIQFCMQYQGVEKTPADFTHTTLSVAQVRKLQEVYAFDDIYTLSPLQEGLLFHALNDGDSDQYFLQISYLTRGMLDMSLVRKTLNDIVKQYDVLRTAFLWEGFEQPMQLVLKDRAIEVAFTDISGEHNRESAAALVEAMKRQDRQARFDVTSDPLLRLKIMQCGEGEYYFIWSYHHLLMDGWCIGIILQDFNRIYHEYAESGKSTVLSLRPYADYIQWVEARDKTLSENYWKDYLSGYETVVKLPQLPQQGSTLPYALATSTLTLDEAQTEQLQACAAGYGVTINTLIQFVWGTLLAKYNNCRDVVFGIVVAGRPSELPGVENMVGLFINTVPIRITFDRQQPIGQILKAMQDAAIESNPHHYHPLTAIQNGSNPGRDLLNHILVFDNYPIQQEVEKGVFNIEQVSVFEQTNYDLAVVVVPGEQLHFKLDYNAHVYSQEIMQQVTGHLQQLMSQIVSLGDVPVSAIDMLTDKERQQLLETFNTTAQHLDGNVPAAFRRQVLQSPDSPALRHGVHTTSYKELDILSGKMADYLVKEAGIAKGEIVAVRLDRVPNLLPVILGILRAGAVYLPIDASLPAERVNHILADAGAKLLIAAEIELAGRQDVYEATAPVNANDPAYVIYTSGSTGKPKGVEVSHGALWNYISWAAAYYLENEKGSFPLFTSISFDLTLTSIFVPLVSGGEVVLYSAAVENVINDIIEDNCTDTIKLTPTHLRLLAQNDALYAAHSKVKRFIVGGELLESSLAAEIHRRSNGRIAIYNEYGPTEATVGCMIYQYDPADKTFSVPIGKPIQNTGIYLLDNDLNPIPVGGIGELHIAGSGLALGYRNNPALTQEKFPVALLAGSVRRMYKTGDLARWIDNGNIEYLGRLDDQVKIRGFRIELGEITNRLNQFEGVRDNVVLAYGEGAGKYLVAYYAASADVQPAALQEYLAVYLPSYMVPAYFMRLDQLPVTGNGKLDKRALPVVTPAASLQPYVPAGTVEERLLQNVWAAVLGVQPGMEDHFFELGGDSIKSIQVSSRVRSLGYELSVRTIMSNPTIAALARELRPLERRADQAAVIGEVPLTPIQHWFLDEASGNYHHYNQSVAIRLHGTMDLHTLQNILRQLQVHHDALRTVFTIENGVFVQKVCDINMPVFADEADLTSHATPELAFAAMSDVFQAGIDLEKGPLMHARLYRMPSEIRVLIVVHHLVIDGVSWRILLEDFQTLYHHKELPLKTDAYQLWSQQLLDYKGTPAFKKAAIYWAGESQKAFDLISPDHADGKNTYGTSGELSFGLNARQTRKLMASAHYAFNTQINDLLLLALLLGLKDTFALSQIKIDIEGHGRGLLDETVNTGRTIGWFTSLYPQVFDGNSDDLYVMIRRVKEQLRAIPNQGNDYLLCGQTSDAQIVFNYLGQFDADTQHHVFDFVSEGKGAEVAAKNNCRHEFEVAGLVLNHELQMTLKYSKARFDQHTVETLMQRYKHYLSAIIDYCCERQVIVLSPSDVSHPHLSETELDLLQAQFELQDVYTLSPMQEGMLFHALHDPASSQYFEQVVCRVKGALDIDQVARAMNAIVARHAMLRTVFVYDGLAKPLQVVLKERNFDFKYIHLSKDFPDMLVSEASNICRLQDRARKFNLAHDPLMRLTVMELEEDNYEFIWSYHHILMDGWCMGLIVDEFTALYNGYMEHKPVQLPAAEPYARYISWLAGKDKTAAEGYWSKYLDGYENIAVVPHDAGIVPAENLISSISHFTVDKQQTAALHKVSRKTGSTLSTIIQTLWGILMAKYNDTDDVVFGAVVSGRSPEVKGIEKMIGLFINTLPVRVQYGPTDTITGLLKKMQQDMLKNQEYEYLPLSEIANLSQLGRNLINHILVFENFPIQQHEQREQQHFTIGEISMYDQTNYDFCVNVMPGEELRFQIAYDAGKYDERFVNQLVGHFLKIIQVAATDEEQVIADINVLSAAEQHQLLHDFNNTDKDYPLHHTFIDLFEAQVEKTPDAIAVADDSEAISYLTLHERSNQLAHALLSGGLKEEMPVVVLCERSVNMLAGLIGILKAGGAYTPLSPEFPLSRIIEVCKDAQPGILITAAAVMTEELGSALNEALPDLHILYLDSQEWMDMPAHHISAEVRPSNLAYILYTSGSTGASKGVMIEHRSMLNHLFIKVEDMQLNARSIVAQNASQTFDISIWQFLSALIVGGKTRIYAKDTILRPEQFLEAISHDRVTLLQVVPSYLSVMLISLEEEESRHDLSQLTFMIATGEILHKSLVKRWLKLYPDIPVVNAYGPTEAADDITHCILYEVPASATIAIGKACSNLKVYIANKALNGLCPIGVRGEIVVSGAGIGRGYINKPDKTAAAFIEDPFAATPGVRMYRTGDIGRWLPDGSIEFLGRRDDQVKIRGFRIELREISHHIKSHPLIRDSEVLCLEDAGEKYIAAYYVADTTIDQAELRSYLLGCVPEYMVPGHYYQLEQMPVNTNGKIDKKVLKAMAMQTAATDMADAVGTPHEELLREVWSQVLGVKRPRIRDNFFLLGGDSIKSIQISSRVRGLGYHLSVRSIMTAPTIADLARLLRPLVKTIDQSEISGPVLLTPVQRWFLLRESDYRHHYNQSVFLEFDEVLDIALLRNIFSRLLAHHDALRIVFSGDMTQEIQGSDAAVWVEEITTTDWLKANQSLQASIDLAKGPLLKAALYQQEHKSRLIIVAHHLVIDGVSWRILFDDFETLYRQLRKGEEPVLPLKTNSFQTWAYSLEKYRESATFKLAGQHWLQDKYQRIYNIPKDNPAGANNYGLTAEASFRLTRAATQQLLTTANRSFNTQVNDLLLASLSIAMADCFGLPAVKIEMESHGRNHPVGEIDINRTIGWFTAIYPLLLSQPDENGTLANHIKAVKENIRAVPNEGFDYLFYQQAAGIAPAQISFNYLGQFDEDLQEKSFRIIKGQSGDEIDSRAQREYELVFSGIILDGRLEMRLMYSSEQFLAATPEKLMKRYEERLADVISYCADYAGNELTPSDLSYKGLSITQLDRIQQEMEVEDIYRLSPMQEGMLFHVAYDAASGQYFEQITARVTGNIELNAVKAAMYELMLRHEILRTTFLYEGLERPLQCVLKSRELPVIFKDVRQEDTAVAAYCEADRLKGFDLAAGPLMRLAILQTGDFEYQFIWSYHHILMDGWCMGVIVNEFKAIYAGKVQELPLLQPYSRYISWMEAQDKAPAATYWKDYLAGYEQLATLPHTGNKLKGYALAKEQCVLDKEQTAQLTLVAGQHGVTVNTVMQAAWAMVLSKYNHTADVVFGSVVSGRPAEIEGIETMIGLFINTLPVRIAYEQHTTVAQLLQQVQQAALDSEPHQYHALSDIQALSIPGNHLFDHLMIFENFPLSEQITTNENTYLQFEDIRGRVETNYDLNVKIVPFEEMEIIFEFNAQVYAPAFIAGVLQQFRNVLHSITEHPDVLVQQVSVYSKTTLQTLTDTYTADLTQENIVPVQQLLSRSIHRHADKTAIEYAGQTFSYKQFGQDVDKCVNALLQQGANTGSRIGVLCDNRYWCIVSMVAVMKARMVFVALDTAIPANRLLSILDQTSCRIVLQSTGTSPAPAENITWVQVDELPTAEHMITFKYDVEDDIYVYFTSGSTGVPKGVVGKNKGLSHFLAWELAAFELTAQHRFGQFTNPGFDVFLRDTLVPLCSGATICIPDKELLYTAEELTSWLSRNRISFMHCVPSLFRIFNTPALTRDTFPALQYILLAGEKIMPVELKNWYDKLGDSVQLVNIYGPTETTLAKSFYRIQPADQERTFIPLQPIPGTQFIILDQQLQLSPAGAVGEIFIRTPYRSSGYLGMAAENQKAFIPNPLGTDVTDLLYRTGDMGRIHDNGTLEILNRKDHQVKIRGVRVELDDIRHNLLDYIGIKEAVVILKEDEEHNQFLAAYFTADTEKDLRDIKSYLATQLPPYMQPAHLLQLTAFPLTSNGKLDRTALPDPENTSPTLQPVTDTERKLLEIWADILHIAPESIREHQRFMELGGHSIKAFYLLMRIKNEFAVSLQLKELFVYNELRPMAAFIAARDKTSITPIPKAPVRAQYALSRAQERIFYQHLLHEENAAYNISVPVQIHGPVNLPRIRDTFNQLIDRHGSLRTGFRYDEEGIVQVIYDHVSLELEMIDATSPQDAFTAFIQPKDLFGESLIKVGIYQGAAGDNYMFIDLHHIIADGFSLNILVQDFIAIYHQLSPDPVQATYVDYVHWLQAPHAQLAEQSRYWLNKLSGQLPVLNMPVSGNTAGGQGSGKQTLPVDAVLTRQLRDLAAEQDVSDYMLLLSIFYILMSRVAGSSDIIIGTDVLGRTHPDLMKVVGTFVNMLPLRMTVNEEDAFTSMLQTVKTVVLEAFDHQDLQYDQMLAQLSDEQDKQAVVRVHFTFANLVDQYPDEQGFEIVALKTRKQERVEFELMLEVRQKDDQLTIDFVYDQSKYDDETISLLKDYYKNIMFSVLENHTQTIRSIK